MRTRTSMIRHNARIAFGRYITSELGCISFMILLVTIMTSSAVVASSFMARYTACRRALYQIFLNFISALTNWHKFGTYILMLEEFRNTKEQCRRLLGTEALPDI